MSENFSNPCSLYVWGNNCNSELGLMDQEIEEHKSNYTAKSTMRKPVKHDLFKSMIQQVAPGNVNTVFLCSNPQSEATFIVQCGMTFVQESDNKDANDDDILGDYPIDTEEPITEIRKENICKFKLIPSIPYQVDFLTPVTKVICGDLFAGLLTAQGKVFTWGENKYGQLGINDDKLLISLNPKPISFTDPDDKKVSRAIVDLVSGYNHCMALGARGEVFVWGRRMGVY